MPIEGPAVSSRGYFIYAPAASNHAPAIVALRKWLTDAGRATEAALPGVSRVRPTNKSRTGRRNSTRMPNGVA